ncbi:pentatricopeptide repeat-containing protein At5g66520-like [Phragmites australis]|uniref:pentatricopeptide repeat-containing protein At5g66520-like n=1 Tax=Phragmites australis TaxID=29695 RepID=UPI002D78EC6C|nr:pentatricopeptide repeat-containing protein At5g66520-like [Phragmites australis]
MHGMATAAALQLLCRPSLSTAQLRQLHAHLLTSSLLADRFLPNILLRSLLPTSPLRALRLFPRLRRILPDFRPNNYTFSFLLTAASSLLPPSTPQESQRHAQRLVSSLHALAVLLAYDAHTYVSNGLIHAYASHGLLRSARRLFDESLSSCRTDVCSWTSLLTGYAKAGRVDEARALFDAMPRRNDVSWSAMLSAYVDAGSFTDAVQLFEDMLRSGVRPNRAAVVGVLAACGALGALEQGRWVHASVAGGRGRGGHDMDGVVATALVDMYAKCGNLDTARQVFVAATAEQRDVFAYTAMISGLSDHGRCREAIDLLGQMQAEGVRPNEVTFICVLTACGRAGLVERAKEIFCSMAAVYGIEPGVEHYGCLVDVLSRAGRLAEALDVVRAMRMRPDSYVLGALLNACTAHGDVELGKRVVEWLAELGLDHSGVHVQLSNMYAGWSKWEDVVKVRRTMEERKVVKVPGCSMVEVDGVACEFVAGDRSHPEVMAAARDLDGQLRLLGQDCYLEDVESSGQ